MSELLETRVERRVDRGGVAILDLVAAGASALPRFQPGAHVDVHLSEGIVRQYSLCNDPADSGVYRLGVLLDPASRGGSAAVHAGLHEGARVTIGVPRNRFPLAEHARAHVLIGGGIGITPMIAMAFSLHETERRFDMHYCSRSRSRGAFVTELAESPFAGRVHFHFDDAEPSQRFDANAVLGKALATEAHVYLCGPAGFMKWLEERAAMLGIPADHLHRESFGSQIDHSGRSFKVEAARSGLSVHVAPGETIARALGRVGIAIPVSCEEGVCGTCVCTVLDGGCDHRDSYLTENERAAGDLIIACCSRAAGERLVLDL
ncbi:MAG: 2Fe-2S iron-sulfur cluster-binding protein [Lautropia sp.]